MKSLIVLGRQDIYTFLMAALENSIHDNVRLYPLVKGYSYTINHILTSSEDINLLSIGGMSERLRVHKASTLNIEKVDRNFIETVMLKDESYSAHSEAILFALDNEREITKLYVEGVYETQYKLNEFVNRLNKIKEGESLTESLLVPVDGNLVDKFTISKITSRVNLIATVNEDYPDKVVAKELLNHMRDNLNSDIQKMVVYRTDNKPLKIF